jgi:RES domain-containing protein
MKAWRLCRREYSAGALSGEGALLAGGRWNSAGTPMVYLASSLALAVLEVFVHMDLSESPEDMISLMIDIPVEKDTLEGEKAAVLRLLPSSWRERGSRATQKLGDEWIVSGRSAVLPVPSVVVPGEWNVLLNPLHRDASRIKVLETKPFRFDARMFKRKI